MGRLSASELCSLPMVPAAVAAEERRNGRRPLRRRGDRAGTGGLRCGGYTGCDVGIARPAHAWARTVGTERPYLGKGLQGGAAGLHAARPPAFFGETKGKEAGGRREPATPATCGRRRTHSLAPGAAGSFLPRRGLAATAAIGGQFRVRVPPPTARGRAGRLTLPRTAGVALKGQITSNAEPFLRLSRFLW